MVDSLRAGLAPGVDGMGLAADRDTQGLGQLAGCADHMEPAGHASVVALDRRVTAPDAAVVAAVVPDKDGVERGAVDPEGLVAARLTSPAAADSIDYTPAERLAASAHFHHKSYLTSIYSLFRFIYKNAKPSKSRSALNSIFNPS